MKLLLDTNICIYIIKKKPPEVLQRFSAYRVDEIGISSITVAELTYGAQKSKNIPQNLQALEKFILPLKVCDFDKPAAAEYGKLRAALEAQGQPVGSLDMLIAAQALSLNIPLITNNTKEFSRISGLSIQDWVVNP
jgi:tRNA(fMet)-specific endonuclease VapC